MASRIELDGEAVDIQDAFNAISTKMKVLELTMAQHDESTAQGNPNENCMDLTLGATNNRPAFDLVSSIPTFDGGHAESINTFFDTIDCTAELSGWSDVQKLQVVKLKLSGSALQYSKSDDACKNATTSADFRKALVSRFGDTLPDHFYLEQLASIRQNRGETIELFADRVKRVCDKTIRTTLNPEANTILKEESDRRAMEAFVRGLNGEIGRQTRMKFPKTYREAVSTAIALHNLEVRPHQEEERPRRVFGAGFGADINCYSCGKAGHKAKDCRQAQFCSNCKRRGHHTRDCRSNRGPTSSNDPAGSNNWSSGRGSRGSTYRGGSFSYRGRPGRYQRGSHHDQPLNTNGVPRNAAGHPQN